MHKSFDDTSTELNSVPNEYLSALMLYEDPSQCCMQAAQKLYDTLHEAFNSTQAILSALMLHEDLTAFTCYTNQTFHLLFVATIDLPPKHLASLFQ